MIKLIFYICAAPFYIIGALFGLVDTSNKDNNPNGLTKEENDIIKKSKGNYKDYNFEEEDLEEDDYYYEDND